MPLRKFAAGAVQADAALGPRQIRAIVSTPTPDRADDVMVPRGCDLTNYSKNPIVLADHDHSQPIGTAAVSVFDDRVEAVVTYADAGVSAKADEYCALAKSGVMRAFSIGFRPVESEEISDESWGRRFTKWELWELSQVAVPANAEALVVARSAPDPGPRAHAAAKCGASLGVPVAADAPGDLALDALADRRARHKGAFAYEGGDTLAPFAFVRDGRLVVTPKSLAAGRAALLAARDDVAPDVFDKAVAAHGAYAAKLAAAGLAGAVKAGAVLNAKNRAHRDAILAAHEKAASCHAAALASLADMKSALDAASEAAGKLGEPADSDADEPEDDPEAADPPRDEDDGDDAQGAPAADDENDDEDSGADREFAARPAAAKAAEAARRKRIAQVARLRATLEN